VLAFAEESACAEVIGYSFLFNPEASRCIDV
jgi:hypothetical protein